MPTTEKHDIIETTLKNVSDLCFRLDERLKGLTDRMSSNERKADELGRSISKVENVQAVAASTIVELRDVVADVGAVAEDLRRHELRLNAVEAEQGHEGSTLKTVGGFIFQTLWVVVAAVILWKMHLQPAP